MSHCEWQHSLHGWHWLHIAEPPTLHSNLLSTSVTNSMLLFRVSIRWKVGKKQAFLTASPQRVAVLPWHTAIRTTVCVCVALQVECQAASLSPPWKLFFSFGAWTQSWQLHRINVLILSLTDFQHQTWTVTDMHTKTSRQRTASLSMMFWVWRTSGLFYKPIHLWVSLLSFLHL